MQIDAISTTAAQTGGIQSIASGLTGTAWRASGETDSAPFAGLFSDAVGQIDELENKARITVDRMMTGSGVDVHQAMIATQKASMAFELALAVRNKAVQAYQSVMGMQL
jgi:flagellar hook-basal body complex protein FliE